MFSEMVQDLARSTMPDPDTLRRRFDMAVTKKQGVVRLPPSFWVDDPKINPRTDHLFWAALLIGDRQRIDLALAVISTELMEVRRTDPTSSQQDLTDKVQRLTGQLFDRIPDPVLCRELRQRLQQIIPEWLNHDHECTS